MKEPSGSVSHAVAREGHRKMRRRRGKKAARAFFDKPPVMNGNGTGIGHGGPLLDQGDETYEEIHEFRRNKETDFPGEEKGFLTYDDVNDMLPSDIVSSDELDDIIVLFGEKNIDIIDIEKGTDKVAAKGLPRSRRRERMRRVKRPR